MNRRESIILEEFVARIRYETAGKTLTGEEIAKIANKVKNKMEEELLI